MRQGISIGIERLCKSGKRNIDDAGIQVGHENGQRNGRDDEYMTRSFTGHIVCIRMIYITRFKTRIIK